jgi:hypothetical protein
MATIVTYDITTKHVEFKKMMFQLEYKDQITDSTCKVIYFPNTTLYHPTKNAVTARDEARNIANRLGINLERCVAAKWENWAAICGEPFK